MIEKYEETNSVWPSVFKIKNFEETQTKTKVNTNQEEMFINKTTQHTL